MAIVHKIGRRKTSVARVYLQEGNGEIFINGRELANYFPTAVLQYKVEQPFLITETKDKYNVDIKVFGGGITGQAESIRLAISRALCEVDADFRLQLKPKGLLTRDPRMVERKKFGQKKARKKFQFSKR